MANNSIGISVVKVAQLSRNSDLSVSDYFLVIESGSYHDNSTLLSARKSTFQDLDTYIKTVDRKFSGSFSGSLKGEAYGNFSGSFFGNLFSKNLIGSGSFSGSLYGSLSSKYMKATGSFTGNTMYGDLIGSNLSVSGSFSGSISGSNFIGNNVFATGSFSGSIKGRLESKNTIATGSVSGSLYGNVISKNASATGDFSGSFRGGGNFTYIDASGSFLGELQSTNFDGKGNILSTGSLTGTNYTSLNGISISYNGTSSYSVSSSYVETALNCKGRSISHNVYFHDTFTGGSGWYVKYLYVEKPSDAVWIDFELFLDFIATHGDIQSSCTCYVFDQLGNDATNQYLSETATGNIGMTISKRGNDASMMCHWKHIGEVPVNLLNTNRLIYRMEMDMNGGLYSCTHHYGMKARYYIP